MSEVASRQAALLKRRVHSSGFRLGVVDVDPGTGTATGPGGSVHLDPKVIEVLTCLVAARGNVVSRESLMKEVWADVIVTDFALSRCIYQLRKALSAVAQTDDSAIETLPKRGYRLNWPMEDRVSDQGLARKGRVQNLAIAAGIAVVLLVGASLWVFRDQLYTDKKTGPPVGGEDVRLVVFPFEDLSEDQDQQVFSSGLAREVLHQLAALPDLCLIGRSSSFNIAGRDTLEHARLLGADYLLEGSIRPIGSNRRVLVDLKTVPEGEQLWSHSFLLEPDAPFHVMQRVAEETVKLFQFSTDPGSIRASTTNLEAFESYLNSFETRNIDVKRRVLQRAVDLDPKFARAWNRLAAIEVLPVWNGETTVGEAWERSRPLVEKALEIDPGLPGTFVTLGRFRREFGGFDEAIELFQKALELDPGHRFASANLGMMLRFSGRFEEALAIHEMAVAMDSLDALSRVRLGTSQWFMENHEKASRQYERAAELAPENEEIYDSWSAMLALGMGHFDRALIKMKQKKAIEGQPTPRTLVAAARWASVLGLDDLAERDLHLAQRLAPEYTGSSLVLATHRLARGEDASARNLALRLLEDSETDPDAHLILGMLDLEAGLPDRFLERVQSTFPEMQMSLTELRPTQIDTALVVALANLSNGRKETATPLLQAVVDALDGPRSREHFWLAAAHAMRGDIEQAISELRTSPPGWIRQHSRLLMRDPRFAALHDLPEFQALITEHIEALDRQREVFEAGDGYLASSGR